ncbi:hypothetical protein [Sulfitobacter guttiformis]|uniref:Flp pilus assembly pilin Flp n=1 Tax=Sulfitobacter guttiformis TaxID=74349 RepID=A0A420DTA3_9RHOB|nr:hypothetical protein [Sulfitobacter guttiformis]KIN74816.1 hypothetical protein Z949_4022 [Sulfitobacter guttiformis KCTC 32187]RKE97388.1 hypothetical protein C8N30_1992 [Sulfitobacter guttiformis]
MQLFTRNFLKETSGAVTVDWVVLTAAVVGLGLAAAISVANGATGLGENLGAFLETEQPFPQNE